ncbi:MAG: hypothetical protein HKN14_06900 [Marinicaulis sp.]|nr:hypothetical protein [Marinicaulis sp.]NNE40632.1 hypothetical protein [Marinicaulis sp.]NNL87830.1 hypothetical protein [Marinicaulis sp.]
MKHLLTIGAAAAAMFGAANAGEWADACTATLEAEGRDASGCQCLEDAIAGDEALIAEFLELGEVADASERYEQGSDEAKSVMDSCTRG